MHLDLIMCTFFLLSDLKAAVDGDKDNYEAGAANKEKEHTIPSPDSSQEYTTAKPNTKYEFDLKFDMKFTRANFNYNLFE